ncbi:hypothetical protein Tco_1117584 [Tanacetum coccineum]
MMGCRDPYENKRRDHEEKRCYIKYRSVKRCSEDSSRLEIKEKTVKLCSRAESFTKQADWLEDTDEEIDEQELEAHYIFMAMI